MKIINTHKRIINQPISEVGVLLDSLSSKNDKLWPHEKWPPMRFDRALSEGAIGGHGPIKYAVTDFKAGNKINFKFIKPSGFQGNHWFELKEKENKKTEIIHTISMSISGSAILSWPIVIRPLHDALIEDSFDKLQNITGPESNKWSLWVKFLRWALKKKKSP
jgi:hypothetical protein